MCIAPPKLLLSSRYVFAKALFLFPKLPPPEDKCAPIFCLLRLQTPGSTLPPSTWLCSALMELAIHTPHTVNSHSSHCSLYHVSPRERWELVIATLFRNLQPPDEYQSSSPSPELSPLCVLLASQVGTRRASIGLSSEATFTWKPLLLSGHFLLWPLTAPGLTLVHCVVLC